MVCLKPICALRTSLFCLRRYGKARHFPVESLKHIIVAGASQFNSELLTFLGKRGVRLSFLDYYGNFAGSLEAARPHASGAVHLAQAKIILDKEKRLALGKQILSAALDRAFRARHLRFVGRFAAVRAALWLR